MKYTKKQRHEIYKEVLSLGYLDGTCTKILHTIRKDNMFHSYRDVREQFEELMLFMPSDDTGIFRHWFEDEIIGGYKESNRDHRETILEFCIYMTK